MIHLRLLTILKQVTKVYIWKNVLTILKQVTKVYI